MRMYIPTTPMKRKQPSMARNHMFGVRILTFMGFLILLARTMLKNDKSAIQLQMNRLEDTRWNCAIKPLNKKEDLFKFVESSMRKCNNTVSFGSVGVCTDRKLDHRTCTVYTFGLSFNWQFEDAISNRGCMVHVFDPRVRQEDFQRSPNILFHNLGVSHLQATIDGPYGDQGKECKGCKVDTFHNIIHKLSHKDTPLSLVRLNMGGGVETAVLAEVFLNSPEVLDNVVQLHVTFSNLEMQLPEDGKASQLVETWQVIQQLKCAGFVLTDVHPDADRSNKNSKADASKSEKEKDGHLRQVVTVWVNTKK